MCKWLKLISKEKVKKIVYLLFKVYPPTFKHFSFYRSWNFQWKNPQKKRENRTYNSLQDVYALMYPSLPLV